MRKAEIRGWGGEEKEGQDGWGIKITEGRKRKGKCSKEERKARNGRE